MATLARSLCRAGRRAADDGRLHLSRLPEWMIRAGQLFIGIALATRFSPAFLHAAPRYLATSPGGIAEMSLTAKTLHLGLPIVTAFHVAHGGAGIADRSILFPADRTKPPELNRPAGIGIKQMLCIAPAAHPV
ncbi:AbrB family transcriptional regulator [Janthinobacterium sp. GB4P2]|uniref:AbrB family transcriptional regulator n=1 Tax=Janthinobacterium sp. GB4P2 TaxID=3424189 RepID=UPI003F206A6B